MSHTHRGEVFLSLFLDMVSTVDKFHKDLGSNQCFHIDVGVSLTLVLAFLISKLNFSLLVDIICRV